jgi:hypothetical protein
VFAHFARKVGENEVSVLIIQFHPEHGIRQRFTDYPFNFYRFFFSHNNSLADYSCMISREAKKVNSRYRQPVTVGTLFRIMEFTGGNDNLLTGDMIYKAVFIVYTAGPEP